MARQHITESTPEALQRVATELFSEYGYAGVTVEQIARKARANKAAISYHFGGKLALYRAILARGFGELGRRMEAVRAEQALPEERLARFVAEFRSLARDNPAFPRIMLREAMSGGRNLDPEVFPHFLRVFELLSDIVDQGVRLGRFRAVDPLQVQIATVGTMVFYFSTTLFRQRIGQTLDLPTDVMDEDRFFEHWTESIAHSLRAPVPPAAGERRTGD